MSIISYLSAATNSKSLQEFALARSVISTLVINALNGISILLIVTLPLLGTLSVPLLLSLVVVFGPFAGVLISFLYPQVESWIGQKFGGKASFKVLYLLFSWTFFPVGLTSFLSWPVVVFLQGRLGSVSLLFTLIPLLTVLCLTSFSYGLNVITLHRLPKVKGIFSLLLTLLLFLCFPAAILLSIYLSVDAVRNYFARKRSGGIVKEKTFVSSLSKAVFVIFLLYAVVFAGIVVYDEDLDPQITKALTTPHPDPFVPSNSWLALLDFSSRTGGPPFEKTTKRLRAVKMVFLAGNDAGCGEEYYEAEKDILSFQGKLPEFYTAKGDGIADYSSAHPAEVEQLVSDNRQLLERYADLPTYNQFVEPLDSGFCTPVPRYTTLRDIQKLKFLHLARIAQQGDSEAALFEVQKDADFWRLVAIRSKTLISKMIALSMLGVDVRFTAELGTRLEPGNNEELRIVQAILRPFSQGETAFASTLEGEAILTLLSFKSFADLARQDDMPRSLLFKPNATRNKLYSHYRQFIALSKRKPQDFAALFTPKEHTDALIRNWSALYNPVGEILSNIAQPSIAGHIQKGHDLEGLRRLALLKIMAANQQVTSGEMQQFLDIHKAEYSNPYTGESMKWDATRQRLFLKSVGSAYDVEIFI